MKIASRIVKMIFLLVLSMILSSTFGACEPGITIRVRNNTNETLQIFFWEEYINTVVPGKEVKFETPAYDPQEEYKIIAKDEKGTVVYSKIFSITELKNIKYRVVIPATANNLEHSDLPRLAILSNSS